MFKFQCSRFSPCSAAALAPAVQLLYPPQCSCSIPLRFISRTGIRPMKFCRKKSAYVQARRSFFLQNFALLIAFVTIPSARDGILRQISQQSGNLVQHRPLSGRYHP